MGYPLGIEQTRSWCLLMGFDGRLGWWFILEAQSGPVRRQLIPRIRESAQSFTETTDGVVVFADLRGEFINAAAQDLQCAPLFVEVGTERHVVFSGGNGNRQRHLL